MEVRKESCNEDGSLKVGNEGWAVEVLVRDRKRVYTA